MKKDFFLNSQVTSYQEKSISEQLYIKYLSFSTQNPRSLIKNCNKAKLEPVVDMKDIEIFIRKLLKYNLIELIYEM